MKDKRTIRSRELKSHENGLVDELVVEVRGVEVAQAVGSLFSVLRREVLLEKKGHLLLHNSDRLASAADAPNRVEAAHASAHANERKGLSNGLLGERGLLNSLGGVMADKHWSEALVGNRTSQEATNDVWGIGRVQLKVLERLQHRVKGALRVDGTDELLHRKLREELRAELSLFALSVKAHADDQGNDAMDLVQVEAAERIKNFAEIAALKVLADQGRDDFLEVLVVELKIADAHFGVLSIVQLGIKHWIVCIGGEGAVEILLGLGQAEGLLGRQLAGRSARLQGRGRSTGRRRGKGGASLGGWGNVDEHGGTQGGGVGAVRKRGWKRESELVTGLPSTSKTLLQ
eukprot:m.284370 g.284370  ORF g.284370 m.284370 type:complete len:346 (+) comp11130_c0_seq1:497-1534(+)